MPELTPQERLQPALLDRLTDDEPGETLEPRERRVMSKTRLRQAVLRDLAWLFNATRLNVIGVEIRGELWAQPVPLELLVRTEIDLETGKVEIADLLSRGV
jgi:predicted component of type VI protein secretion system